MLASGVVPVISVIIPNRNGLMHLDTCLSALYAQTFRNFEIILVDNGSRDASVDFVGHKFAGTRILCLPQNRGFAGGVNAGLAIARGQFIAFLNNDTEADPRWLEALHTATQANPDYSMWASRVVMFSRPDMIDSVGDSFTRAAVPFKRGHLEPVWLYDGDEEVFMPSGSAALYRRSLFDEIGMLDEDFFLVHEDVDFGVRARLRGHRCQYVAGAIVKHKVNSSIGYMSRAYVFYGHRNLEYVCWKNLPLALLLQSLPEHCAFNMLAFAYFVRRGRAAVFIRGKLAAVANLPGVLRKRKQVQARRTVSSESLRKQMNSPWLKTKLKAAVINLRWQAPRELPTKTDTIDA